MDIWRCSAQYNAALLLSVNRFAQGMFCGPMHTHHTFTPIIEQQVIFYNNTYGVKSQL